MTKKPIWLEAATIAILPCLLLFNVAHVFGPDWRDHSWMTAYTSAYLRDHWAFPRVLNTQGSIGGAVTLFSGYGTYYVLGLSGIFFHPHVMILVAAYGLYALQHGSLVLLLTRMDLPRWFASMAAAMVTFAIYPLTNLYNRGDTPEFFAAVALTIGIVALFLTFTSEKRRQQHQWYAVTLMAFAFMATAHSLTLLNAAVFMALLCPVLLWFFREQFRRMFWMIAGIPAILLPVLAPFLYAYYSVEGKLKVSMDDPGRIAIYSDQFDSTLARLWPLLLPFNSGVPYLEAPANTCLLAMTGIAIVFSLRRGGPRLRLFAFITIMVLLLALYIWSTLSTYPWGHFLPFFLRANQYVYRLVTMVNLTILCTLLGVGLWLKNHHRKIIFPPYIKTLCIVLCTVAACGFAQKMTHALVVRGQDATRYLLTDDYVQQLLNERGHDAYATPTFFKEVRTDNEPRMLDSAFDPDDEVYLGSSLLSPTIIGYGTGITPLCRNDAADTYDIPGLYGPTPMPAMHNFTRGISFSSIFFPYGDVPPVDIHADTHGWYATNVTAFIWSSISVDGKVVPAPRRRSFWFSIYLTPGDHVIAYAFTPPMAWIVLNDIAFGASMTLVLYFLWSFRPIFRRGIAHAA